MIPDPSGGRRPRRRSTSCATSSIRHEFLGVPVVDEARRLLGVVRRAAVEEALAERTDDDYLKTQGIVGGEELRTHAAAARARAGGSPG